MRKLTRYIIAASLCIAIAGDAGAMPPVWEPVKSEQTASAKTVMRESEIEIKAAPGIIIVTTNHQIQIKIFTILGRLVSSETLNPGTARMQLPAHGVYIVKTGPLTCKVAV